MGELWRDSVGFAGAVIVRRLVGIAHVADMDSIAGALCLLGCVTAGVLTGATTRLCLPKNAPSTPPMLEPAALPHRPPPRPPQTPTCAPCASGARCGLGGGCWRMQLRWRMWAS